MAIIFDTRLEAAEILRKEGIEVIDVFSPEAAKRNPVRICVLNLLPEKPAAETQWLRGLSYADTDVQVTFFMVESYTPKHTTQEYLRTFYKTPTQMKDEYYDGLLITGADAEKYKFEDGLYWDELVRIFNWADTHVRSCYFSCWASMAASYHYFGIDKELFGGKISGIYAHRQPHPEHVLMTDIPEPVYIPHSRIARSEEDKIFACKDLTVLAEGIDHGWPTLYCCDAKKQVYIIGHWEYEPFILQGQYIRDTSKGFDMQKPENYFAEDGSIRTDQDWMSQFHTMMRNWIRYYVKG